MVAVGFIGLGVMGRPMAESLVRAGFPLAVFNRTREKCASLAAMGASVKGSPRQVASASEIVITMLADTAAVETVLFGDQGIVGGLRLGSVVIDMSTISPSRAVAFAGRIEAVGCAMLDAPVSGGEKGAIDGTLAIMAGGRPDAFERCLPVLEAMGKSVTYTGPAGNGQRTKLVNQLIAATNLLATVEGIRLSRAAGLDPNVTLKAVSTGAASSWMLVNLGPKILKDDFAPGFSIRLQFKDMELLKEWASELGGDFPAAALVHSLFGAAMKKGLSSQGNQGLIHLWPSS